MGAADLWALNSADIFAVNDFQTGPSVDFFILTIGYNWYHEVLGSFVSPKGSPKGSQSNSSSFRCFVIRLLCGLRVLQMRPQGSFPQDSGNEMEMKVLVIALPTIQVGLAAIGDTMLCLMT